MKIEIQQPVNPARLYNIYSGGKPIRNIKGNMFPYEFSEDEIEFILKDQYNSFCEGKYKFNVPAKIINIISGSPVNLYGKDQRSLLLLIEEWNNL